MSEVFTPADRRQFGRRPVNVAAAAVLPGGLELACVIQDISDGGALLYFGAGAAPIQPFELHVEDTDHRLKCEIRHSSGPRLGVMFTRLAQGRALNSDLQRQPIEPAASNRYVRAATAKPIVRSSVRELRRTVMGGRAGEVATAGPVEPQPPMREPAPTQSCDATTDQAAA